MGTGVNWNIYRLALDPPPSLTMTTQRETSPQSACLVNQPRGAARFIKGSGKESGRESDHHVSRWRFAGRSLPTGRKPQALGEFRHLSRLPADSKNQKKASHGKPFNNWCGRRDLNPHSQRPLPPQDSVSTNSTTPANCVHHSPSTAGASFRGRSP